MTTRDEVLAMAEQAGLHTGNQPDIAIIGGAYIPETYLLRFAALAFEAGRKAEREECAKDKVDAERYRWLCADMPGSDEADARYRVLQRMDMMGKGAIDSEIDNWRIK